MVTSENGIELVNDTFLNKFGHIIMENIEEPQQEPESERRGLSTFKKELKEFL